MSIPKTFSAPMAVIRFNSKEPTGYLSNLSFTETYSRVDVKGIGVLFVQEVPAVGTSCNFTCASAVIDISRLGTSSNQFIPARNAQTKDQYERTFVLQDQQGVQIDIFRKIPTTVDQNGVVQGSDDKRFVTINDAFIESQSWNISESNIVTTNLSGRYLIPIFGDYIKLNG